MGIEVIRQRNQARRDGEAGEWRIDSTGKPRAGERGSRNSRTGMIEGRIAGSSSFGLKLDEPSSM